MRAALSAFRAAWIFAISILQACTRAELMSSPPSPPGAVGRIATVPFASCSTTASYCGLWAEEELEDELSNAGREGVEELEDDIVRQQGGGTILP
eukprot:3172191-Heterocapsa_arctica.AAC.1